MDNIFRGQILTEVKYIPETNQWVVNGVIVEQNTLTETETITLQHFNSNSNWQLLKGEAKTEGKLV